VLTLFTSTEGRLRQRTFWLCLLAIYAAGIAAQTLLAPEITGRAGFAPFIAVQAALTWAWLCVHIQRLRDAGQGKAGAISVALIYTLSVCLLLMMIAFLTNPNDVGSERPAGAAASGMLLVLAIFGLLFSPDFGVYMAILKVLVFIACLPAMISLAFSLTTGLRKSMPPAAP